MTVAESQLEHTQNCPDLEAEKPAKAEETFDACSSKLNIFHAALLAEIESVPNVWK